MFWVVLYVYSENEVRIKVVGTAQCFGCCIFIQEMKCTLRLWEVLSVWGVVFPPVSILYVLSFMWVAQRGREISAH